MKAKVEPPEFKELSVEERTFHIIQRIDWLDLLTSVGDRHFTTSIEQRETVKIAIGERNFVSVALTEMKQTLPEPFHRPQRVTWIFKGFCCPEGPHWVIAIEYYSSVGSGTITFEPVVAMGFAHLETRAVLPDREEYELFSVFIRSLRAA